MIQVEGHWESVADLHDVSRVIREYYNSELADELDDMIGGTSEDAQRILELEDLIEEIRMLVG